MILSRNMYSCSYIYHSTHIRTSRFPVSVTALFVNDTFHDTFYNALKVFSLLFSFGQKLTIQSTHSCFKTFLISFFTAFVFKPVVSSNQTTYQLNSHARQRRGRLDGNMSIMVVFSLRYRRHAGGAASVHFYCYLCPVRLRENHPFFKA